MELEKKRKHENVSVCSRTGRRLRLMRGLVGRAICFNEKVVPAERKGPGCRLFVHGLSSCSVIKSTGTYVCVRACVYVWVCAGAIKG